MFALRAAGVARRGTALTTTRSSPFAGSLPRSATVRATPLPTLEAAEQQGGRSAAARAAFGERPRPEADAAGVGRSLECSTRRGRRMTRTCVLHGRVLCAAEQVHRGAGSPPRIWEPCVAAAARTAPLALRSRWRSRVRLQTLACSRCQSIMWRLRNAI
ncbi:MAG: hypothetical protein J3K34DRAFT_165612 [Monoraphidium minutum]|nr:MAG: hypothetical protein J3K34DRAFT_165612 [Monoraphidium minutum]